MTSQSLLKRLIAPVILVLAGPGYARETLSGDLRAHDPSTIVRSGDLFHLFHTGHGIASKHSPDLRSWTEGKRVFSGKSQPPWIADAVPGFKGHFWAPEIVAAAPDRYFLYYSVSTWGSQVSAIGLATRRTLDPATPGQAWVDQGPVIRSKKGSPYNCIDPSVMIAPDGGMWMAFGSFWDGIHLVELNPENGRRVSENSPVTRIASLPSTEIEAPCLIHHRGFFYLFVNWGKCCRGVDSTYQIRVGRSNKVTGPYLDRDGKDMAAGGGSLFLDRAGRFIGPGHAGILKHKDRFWFSHHYYDGGDRGRPKAGLARLNWSEDAWPVIANE